MLNRRQFIMRSSATLAAAAIPGCANDKKIVTKRQTHSADVVVAGAGYAGLLATKLLREAGIHTVLLEGADRVGGRVHTLKHLPGKPEAGAVEMGNSYTELLRLCDEFDLRTESQTRRPGGYALSVGGALMSTAQWPTSGANRLVAAERGITPDRLLSRYLPKRLPVANLDTWGSGNWLAQDYSLADYLRRAGASPEAIRLIAANLNGHDIEDLSWADVLKGILLRRNSKPSGTFNVAGGLYRVSAALAKAAGDSLRLKRKLQNITARGNRVTVSCADGTTVAARLMICAIPFSTLRKITIDADLSAPKQAAIQGLRYTPVTRIFMRAHDRFWESDGLPQHTWTDTALGRMFVSSGDDFGIRIGVFSIGKAAKRLDAMVAQGAEAVIKLVNRVRPSTTGMIELEEIVSWGSEPLALGAFSHYPAGSLKDYARAVSTPEGALVFAGEHTEIDTPGVQAALVSGRRAARQALQILAGRQVA